MPRYTWMESQRLTIPEQMEYTIHEAFRSLHAADIAAIYRRQLTPTEQSALLSQAEMFHRNRMECFIEWMGKR